MPQIAAPKPAAGASRRPSTRRWVPAAAGSFVRTWGRPSDDPEIANARTTCAVMIESARGPRARGGHRRRSRSRSALHRSARPVALLGHHGAALLQDDSDSSPLRRIVAAAEAAGLEVGAFGGVPAVAEHLPAHGITCLVVATDLWLLGQGARGALSLARQLRRVLLR